MLITKGGGGMAQERSTSYPLRNPILSGIPLPWVRDCPNNNPIKVGIPPFAGGSSLVISREDLQPGYNIDDIE